MVPWPDDDGESRRLPAVPLVQQGDSVDIGHPDVEQGDIGVVLAARDPRVFGVTGHGNRVAFLFQDLAQQIADVRFIIDNEYACGAHTIAPSAVRVARAGNRTWIDAPPSGRFPASIEPPCSSTIRRTIDNPRPLPRDLPVIYGSNSRSIM